MNNNNNIYNNNFIGSTHIDAYKSTSNFIISTSNIIESHLSNTSNTLENHLYASNIANSNFTTNTSNHFSKMIDYQIEHISLPISKDLTHTYINNSNLGGEIRFWTKSTSLFPPQIPLIGDPEYRVKIDVDGKLKLYYTYDSSINATWGSGWIDIGNILIGILANNVNTGITIGGLQIEITALQDKEEIDIEGVYAAIISLREGDLPYDTDELETYRENIRNALNEGNTNNLLGNAYGSIRNAINNRESWYLTQAANNINLFISRNPLTSFFLGTGGIAFAIAYGIGQGWSFNNYLKSLYQDINSNIHLTQTEKSNLISYTSNELITSNFIDITKSYYDLGVAQGFVNSNIITYQNIPQIQTSNIYVLNSGNINGVGTAYVNVCAAKSLSTTLNTNVGFPTFDAFGGIGDKILLRNGSATSCPISIGIDSNYSLWNSITSNNDNTAFDWYIDGDKKMSIYRDKLETSNLLIFQNGISIPSITQTTILNETPNVYKKYAFNFSCSTAITISGTTYYKYDIDLRNYTQTKPSANPSSPYRIFNIRLFLSSVYFEAMTNNTYNILNYEVYMSNEINVGSDGGSIGINIFANHIGNTLPNPILVNILPSYFTLLRTADFNYLSVISTIQNINLNCIIQDILY